jgi:hypothetical protein
MMVNGEELMVNEDRAMNVVIVATSPLGRTYYEGAYVEGGDPKGPTCWSPDNTKPASDVTDPQASTCMSCAQNIAGSGQGNGRACRYNQRVAVVLEGDLAGDVYQLSLPATSIFGKGEAGEKLPLQAYAQAIVGMRMPIGAVVTEMRFDTSSATPKLTFKAVRYLEEDEFANALAKGKTTEAKTAIGSTPAAVDGAPQLAVVKPIAKAEP